MLYADIELMPGLRWHLIVASSEGRPDMDAARDAREALLPGVEEVCYIPAKEHAGDNAIHICELTETRSRWGRSLQ